MIHEDSRFTSNCVSGDTRACQGESFFRKYEGKRYCVLHFPDPDKKEAFDIAFEKKLSASDSNFKGIWFPRGNLFTGLEIRQALDFTSAFFNDPASFNNTTFKSDVKFEGATFNEDAWFGHASFAGKVDFSSATFRKNADFNRARFEAYANFWRCTFTGRAEFRDAVFLQTASFWPTIFNSTASFTNASFAWGNFGSSEFKDKALFNRCTFGSAEFIGASFTDEAHFFAARFEGMANFNCAKFGASVELKLSTFDGEARFTFATFKGETDFSYTVFKNFVSFSGEHGSGGFGANAACDFRHARFEMPSLVSFHSLTLRPHWFVNVDSRGFEFIDVKWIGNLRRNFIDIEIQELIQRAELEEKTAADRKAERLRDAEIYHDEFEIERMKREEPEESSAETNEPNKKRTRLYRLLSIACRQLAVNAEENHRYDQASYLRFWSMELQRKEGRRADGRLSISILHPLYRYLSGYGEEIGRAFFILLGICLLFAFLYTRVGFVHPPSTSPAATVSDEVGQPLKLTKALAYSLAVITLQRPDPRPLTAMAWFVVLAETILGPIQAALLILAVRRRFMR